MKKILLTFIAFGVAFSGYTQSQDNLSKIQKINPTTNQVIKPQNSINSNRGDSFFSEDFSNGFAGNNGIGAWTATDSEDGSIWHFVNSNNSLTVDGNGDAVVYPDNYPDIPGGAAIGDNVVSPAGEFTAGSAEVASTTNNNGWMIFDVDFYNTPISETGGISVQGFLTSPTLDFSAQPSVIVEFQQYFIYCCFGSSPMSLDVSNDGGTTWVSFPSNDYFIETANSFCDNAMTTSIDVSCVAGGESDVQIRFSYNTAFETAYSHYFWALDDVAIYGNPNSNDLGIDLVTNGDIWNSYEYRVTAMEQAIPEANGGLLVGTYFQNYGTLNQEDVVLTIEILDDENNVVSTTVSNPFEVLSFANSSVCPNKTDSMYVQTGWVPDETGDYTIKASLFADGITDDVMANNVVEKSINYSDVTMGHDDAGQFNIELQQSVAGGVNQTGGFGNYYELNNEDSEVTGIVVYFGPNTSPGSVVQAIVVDVDGFMNYDQGLSPMALIDFEILQEHIPASINATPIATYIEFDIAEDLGTVGNNRYFAGVTVEEGEGRLTVMANANLDSDFSTLVIAQNADGNPAWFNRPDVPAVRLALGQYVGIEKVDALEGVGSFDISPNPASNLTIVNYNLTSTVDLHIEITDITGNKVFFNQERTNATGSHQVEISTSEFANGIYFCSMISGDKRITKKLVVQK